MTNESRDLNRPTEQEKTLAIALIALAGAVFASVFALWPGTLSNLSLTGRHWTNIIVILVLVALATSIIFGGWGFAYGPRRADWGGRFNLQAIFGAAAIFLILVLGIVIFMTREASPNEKFAAKQTELETHLKDLSDKVDKSQAAEIKDLSTKVGAVSNDISDLKTALDAAQKRLGDLDQSSADHSNKLHAIDDSMKSFSDLPTRVSTISNDVSDLKNALGAAQKKLGDLDQLSADHANKLREIDDSMKSLANLSTKVGGISNDISDLKNTLDKTQKKLGDLDQLSADYSNKLHEIDDSMKSLANRVDQLEKNANQSRP